MHAGSNPLYYPFESQRVERRCHFGPITTSAQLVRMMNHGHESPVWLCLLKTTTGVGGGPTMVALEVLAGKAVSRKCSLTCTTAVACAAMIGNATLRVSLSLTGAVGKTGCGATGIDHKGEADHHQEGPCHLGHLRSSPWDRRASRESRDSLDSKRARLLLRAVEDSKMSTDGTSTEKRSVMSRLGNTASVRQRLG